MDCSNNELNELLLTLKIDIDHQRENEELKKKVDFLQKELADYSRDLSNYKAKYFRAKYWTEEEKKDYEKKKSSSNKKRRKRNSLTVPQRDFQQHLMLL